MQICEIIIPEPLEYLVVGKKNKKYYLTANIFYTTVNHYVRADIVQNCKWFLHNHLIKIPKIEVPISLRLEYYTNKNTEFDIDNKGYFWGKIVQDWMVKNGKIKKDNSKWIQEVNYRYVRGESKLILKIETI